MGLDINLNTSKIDISEDDGLNVDLYNDNIDISDDEADDIIIEITGLKSINKFIGLEDTPLYYDNGKFFKVENNKIVYANIQWKDISGNLEDAPEIIALIEELVEKINKEVIYEYIDQHNNSQFAHPYIQDIIKQNYNTLDTKIDNTKEELSEALNTETTNRETADNELSESIQQETLARIEADTNLQNNIDTLTNNLNIEIENRTNADNLLRDDIDNISGELAQEIIDRQTQDNLLQEQITSNYNTLNGKIDTEISNRTSADTTLQNNIDKLTQTVEDNNTAVNSRIDETNDTVSDLSDTVTSNYNTLDGKIDTEISNRTYADTALQNNIDTEALTRQNADTVLQNNINTLSQTVTDNNTAINNKVDGINTTLTDSINSLSNTVSSNYTTLNTKIDNTRNALDSEISDLSDTVSSNYTTLDTKIDNTRTSLEGGISDLSNTVSQNYTDLNNTITTSASTINSRIDSEVSTLNTAVSTETANRQNADNNLQSQIDAIVSSSDVFDIVGTYAELQAYDISTVPVNDIVKVLVDSSHNNTATYYRCVETSGVKSWSYIGSEGAYYTKSESDTKFVAKTTTINNKPLSSNITLTASDVNALPDTTVIGNGILTLQKNGVNIDTFNANATANKNINITVPTDTADLTNGAGFITSASLPTVNNGTLDIQVNGTSVGTFTANQAGNTTANIVVPDSATWGNITGTLSNQTDLQNALNSKYDASNPNGYINASALNGYATENWVSNQDYVNNTTLATTLNNYVLSADLADVATTGDYDDLINKPTKVTESTVSGWGFTKNVGTVTSVNNILPDSNGNVSIPISGTPTWGEITGDITNQTDLQTALGNFVTLNTAQNISGRKTFLGEKAIYFKQTATTDKLGFTLYNPSNTELGALEWRPNTINGNALLALNCPQSGSNYVGFRYWSNINIVAPRPTTNGNYFIPVNVTDGTNTVTANNNGTLNISTLLPDVSNFVTNSSLATTLADYQPLLVSGSNIKTINGASILGSGNLTLDGLPSQTGQSGKFLTTDGTDASWANTTKVTIRDWSVS